MTTCPSLRGMKVTDQTASFVKQALALGYDQHVIAAYLNDNQGRVSEINTGKRYVNACQANDLPHDFPLVA